MLDHDISLISRCFFPPDNPGPADVGIVFGMNDPRRPARQAIELFHAGAVRRLLFTGGHNDRLGTSEARAMARLAQEGGVPPDAILIEDQARNTDENVRFSKRLLERRFGAGGVDSAMLLTIHYHLRRALLAAGRQFSPRVALRWTCYASLHYDSQTWFEVERGRRDVLSESRKIEQYYGIPLAELLRQTP